MLTRGRSSTRARRRRGNVDARLFELERFYEGVLAATQGPSAEESSAETLAEVRQIIASRGVEQQPSESLFDAFARALGVSSMELRAELAQFASGWRISVP
jgi:phytoene/squalene synthetase